MTPASVAQSHARKTWARLSWQARATAWLRANEHRDYKESVSSSFVRRVAGVASGTYWFLLPSFGITHVSARTLSQMSFEQMNTLQFVVLLRHVGFTTAQYEEKSKRAGYKVA